MNIFLNIVSVDHWVFYFNLLIEFMYIILKNGKFNFIDNHSYLFKCYNVDNAIYFQAIGQGLYKK